VIARRQRPVLLDTRKLHDGWGRYLLATLRLEDGEVVEREVEDHGHAAAVLPYDPERRTALLVRVARTGPLVAGADPYLLEAPAGMLDGDGADEAIRREAMEEVGLRLTTLEPLGTAYSTPGVSTESVALFLAPYAAADRVEAGGGLAEEHENLEVAELPLAELWRRLEAGELRDLKTFALVAVLRARRPELFA
jgi:nudix-type nucleoside diphosphatase (YffH/AdpP family)